MKTESPILISHSRKLSRPALEKKVKEIKKAGVRLEKLDETELWQESTALYDLILNELNSLDEQIAEVYGQLEESWEDPSREIQLEKSLENLENLRWIESEKILEKVLPKAFALVCEVMRRFSQKSTLVIQDVEYPYYYPNDFWDYDSEKSILTFYNTWKVAGHKVTWDMVPRDTQLMVGIAMHYGAIAELADGEGKTLAAVFPAFLNALAGRKVRIATANTYLSVRDKQWMGPILEFLGITVGCIDDYQQHEDEQARIDVYLCDVVYGQAQEFVYDFLYDNLKLPEQLLCQENWEVLLIDDADSILLDDASKPINLTGNDDELRPFLSFYKMYSPAVRKVVKYQKALISENFNKATLALQEKRMADFYDYLILIKRGNPHFKPYNQLMENLTYRNQVKKREEQRIVNYKIEEIDNNLFYTISFTGETPYLELTPKGKSQLAIEIRDPGLWDPYDLDVAFALIREADLPPYEELLEKERVVFESQRRFAQQNAVESLIKAEVLYKGGRDYFVEDDQVFLIDQNSGRKDYGLRFSNGLHQAIEVKEGLEPQDLGQIIATISYPAYVLQYRKIAGMSATALQDKNEFRLVYGLSVVPISPVFPVIRKDLDDLVFLTKKEKHKALAHEIQRLYRTYQPVLIVTNSIVEAQLLSKMLYDRYVEHQVLTAKEDQEENDILAKAGLPGSVIIAVRRAGRGTDIKITSEARQLGGLAVLGAERHGLQRIDRQLRGRAGRQGTPGSSQFFLSLQDQLWETLSPKWTADFIKKNGHKEGKPFPIGILTKSIDNIQRKVAKARALSRTKLVEYDDALGTFRNIIYEKRHNIRQSKRLNLELVRLFSVASEQLVSQCGKNFKTFINTVYYQFAFESNITEEQFNLIGEREMSTRLFQEAFLENYDEIKQQLTTQILSLISSISLPVDQSQDFNVEVQLQSRKKKFTLTFPIQETLDTEGKFIFEQIEIAIILDHLDFAWKTFLKHFDENKGMAIIYADIQNKDSQVGFGSYLKEQFDQLMVKIDGEMVHTLCWLEVYWP